MHCSRTHFPGGDGDRTNNPRAARHLIQTEVVEGDMYVCVSGAAVISTLLTNAGQASRCVKSRPLTRVLMCKKQTPACQEFNPAAPLPCITHPPSLPHFKPKHTQLTVKGNQTSDAEVCQGRSEKERKKERKREKHRYTTYRQTHATHTHKM